MIYQFLATGYEECEALGTVDVCRRAGLDLTIVSVTGNLVVESAHGVNIQADALFEDCDFADADMLMLPGGLPGSTNLDAHEGLRSLIVKHHAEGKMLAAICAAPLVYGHLGLLKGKNATCYPGMESHLEGANVTGNMVEKDGLFITGKGPAAAYALGYAIVEHYKGAEAAQQIAQGMLVI